MCEDDFQLLFTNAVTPADTGLRIDKYIAKELPNLSRSQIQRLIENGYVFSDEETIADKNYKTSTNDVYQITLPPPIEAEPQPENIPLDILYEDTDVIVVNKPAGMTVHPAAGAYNHTLVNALLYHCKDSLSGIGGVARPGIVHRIDRNTSGILVVAKNDFAHRHLSEQFFNHSITRTYYALTYNIPTPPNGRIEGNIARSSFDRKKMALVKTGGKSAVTHYQTIEVYNQSAAMVKCNLETGRTHQIRVHLSSIGCHLIGDEIYKGHRSSLKFPEPLKSQILAFPRQALHAAVLGFIHPRTESYIEFQADFPPDMSDLVARLQKHRF